MGAKPSLDLAPQQKNKRKATLAKARQRELVKQKTGADGGTFRLLHPTSHAIPPSVARGQPYQAQGDMESGRHRTRPRTSLPARENDLALARYENRWELSVWVAKQ